MMSLNWILDTDENHVTEKQFTKMTYKYGHKYLSNTRACWDTVRKVK